MAGVRRVDRKCNWRGLGNGMLVLGLLVPFFLPVMQAAAAEFPLAANQPAVGAVAIYAALERDTLMDVGRHYDLGFTQLMAANRGVNPWSPGNGRRITISNFYLLPDAPRSGIVINLAEQRLYYFPPWKRGR